jgi:hypothetical protein
VVPLAGFGALLDDGGHHVDHRPSPMGPGHRIPWAGTSLPATDGIYAALVIFGGAGVKPTSAARFVADSSGARFEFTGGDFAGTGLTGAESSGAAEQTRSAGLDRLRAEFPALGL